MMDEVDFRNYASMLSSPLPQFIQDSADAIMRGKIFPENSGAYYWVTSILCFFLVIVVAAVQLVSKQIWTPLPSKTPSTPSTPARSSSTSSSRRKGNRRRSSATSTSSGPKVKSKRVVLVDEYGARVENVPLDYVAPQGQEVRNLLSSEEATAKLNDGSERFDAPEGSGVLQIQTATLASNEPMEDAHGFDFHQVGTEDGKERHFGFFGVFDGHYGSTTSSYLRENLVSTVHRNLTRLYNASPSKQPSSLQVDTTIQTCFTDLDNAILSAARKNKATTEELDRALQGSCALLAFHDSESHDLRVAVTGDSRAVLGKRIGSSTTRWLPVELSVDQNFHNSTEEKRVLSAHPGEEGVVKNWRIMGELAVSRAFGDARYKWDASSLPPLTVAKLGKDKVVHPKSKSPPYLTAEPVIKSTKVRAQRGDFLILASDGIWDTLTNEDAVAIVGRWMDEHDPRHHGKTQSSNSSSSTSGGERPKTKLTPDQEEKFVWQDDHAGVHLIRNALGAKDFRVRRSLSVPPGKDLAKRYRDDMTAMIIFFD